MRTISAADDALFTQNGGRSSFVRVDTQDGGGTYRDLTTYLGQNFVTGASWSDGVDGEGQNGSATVKRQVESLNLSPLMQGSAANLAFVYPGSYSPLLFVGRGLRIYTADLPLGQQPISTDWRFMFEGTIDKLDPAGDDIKIEFSDHQAELRDTFIEAERVYSFAQGASATKGCRVWQSLVSFAQNELVIPTDANRNGHFYKANTAGTQSTAGSEPTWPTGSGSTVVDNSETWLEVGPTAGQTIWAASLTVAVGDRIIPTLGNANGHFYIASAITTGITSPTTEPTWPTGAGVTVTDAGVTWKESGAIAIAVESIIAQIGADNGQAITVFTPGGSPGWLIKWFLQQRQSVWDGVRALADQIGWDLRYQWDSGSNTFHLNLWTPNRAKVTPDRTFGPADEWEVSQLEIDRSKIRNAVEVIFSASGSQDPSGNPLRISVIVTDSTSITKYGRRYMLMAEGSTSNIDTTAEATAMANAALSDLKEPNAEKKVVLPYFPFVELGDLYRFSPDAQLIDQNLDLAVVGYEHSFDGSGEACTTLTCRGKPSTGCDRWLAKDTRVQMDDVHQMSLVDSDQPKITAAQVVGGTLLTLATAQNKNAWGQDVEWHVGTASNFTPNKLTLVQSQGGNQITVPHLIPNKAYFAKIVPARRNDFRPVRGQANSAGFGFTAGRASAGHIHEGIAVGDMPLNGGFETWLDPSGPPDHWTVLNGVWGVDFSVLNDANGVSGANYLAFSMNSSPAVLTKMRSAIIPLINDDAANTGLRLTTRYLLEGWVQTDPFNAGGNHLIITAAGVDYQGNLIGLMGGNTISVAATSNPGKWQYVQTLVHCDGFSTMKGVYIVIQTDTLGILGLSNYRIDELRLKKVQSPWYIVNQTTKFTDNYQSVPPFTNLWVADITAPAFRRDPWGYIELKGSIKNGTIGASAFTLPTGFRPPEEKRMPLWSAFNTGGEMDILANGNVVPATGNNGWVSLDGMRFWPYL